MLKKEINELFERLGQDRRYPAQRGPRALRGAVELLPARSRKPGGRRELVGVARFAYLDNALPSLFKERLFVYQSRFCEVRYCNVRHLSFLVAAG